MRQTRHRIKRASPQKRHIPIAPVAVGFALGSAAVAAELYTPGSVFDFSFFKTGGGSLAAVFLSCVIFHVAVIFSATSTLGFALIPASAFVYGGDLAYRSASIISSADASSALKILTGVIVPALFTVPPFFIIACGGIRLSELLRSGGDRHQRAGAVRSFAAEAGLALALAFAAAAYIYYLLPVMST